MKTILNKLEFHYTYLIIALGFVLTGYFINLIAFTSLILVHELGHIITMHHYNFKISKVIIYPYGGLTKLNDIIDKNIDEELIIAISGLFFQTIFYFIIVLLTNHNLISSNTLSIYTLYHYSMLIFNLLPIYPLDGFKILNLYLSKVLSYRLSNIISLIVSVFFILLIAILGFNNYSYFMIITMLIYNLYDFYINMDYLYNKFLLERYLYKLNFKKVKVINDIKSMKRNYTHYLKNDKKIVKEKEALTSLFEQKY